MLDAVFITSGWQGQFVSGIEALTGGFATPIKRSAVDPSMLGDWSLTVPGPKANWLVAIDSETSRNKPDGFEVPVVALVHCAGYGAEYLGS